MAAFLDRARAQQAAEAGPSCGRLIFALDPTMSRQPTWDLATQLQGEMFDAAAAAGGLKALAARPDRTSRRMLGDLR